MQFCHFQFYYVVQVDILIIIRGDLRKEYNNANAAFDEIQVAREGGERWKSMTDEVSVGLSLSVFFKSLVDTYKLLNDESGL